MDKEPLHLGVQRIFTTGEAARICKVSQQTIIRCFDSGRLTGFKVPGSRFRRIPREELARFMRSNGIPLDALDGERRRVLVVDDDPAILHLVQSALGRDGRYDVRTASTGYDAGLLTESFRPRLIVLDLMLPDIDGEVVCARVRARADLESTRILCVSATPDQGRGERARRAGADDFLRKPFEPGTLLARVNQLLADLPERAK
jgi:excisionase family DNA binding protein